MLHTQLRRAMLSRPVSSKFSMLYLTTGLEMMFVSTVLLEDARENTIPSPLPSITLRATYVPCASGYSCTPAVGVVVDPIVGDARAVGGLDVDAVVVIRGWQMPAVVDPIAFDHRAACAPVLAEPSTKQIDV